MSIPGLELERRAIQICRLLRGCDGNRRFQISGARFRVVLGLDWGWEFLLLSFDYFNLLFCVGRTNCEDGFFKRELAC
nr:hypothetical protein CFP56_06247 [Quercus suber]